MTRVSSTAIDNTMNEMYLNLKKKEGAKKADSAMYALQWYILTGRASTDFIRAFINMDTQKKNRMACILLDERSIDETVRRCKRLLKVAEG